MPLIASMAVRIWPSVMAPGSRVNRGSTKKGLSAFTTKCTRSRNVDAWHFVHDLVDLCDDQAIFEGGCLNDRRCVFSVGPGIEIAISVRADRRDQGDMRCQV